MAQRRLRSRPAHPAGPTFLSYTPDGTRLITVGLNNAIRVFQSGSDAEPTNIDDCPDSNTAVAAANGFFVCGSEDGTVRKYSLETNSMDAILVRCTLPIRDVALSPDGNWVAVASDELVVKVVNTDDMTRVLYLRDQPRPVKHVSFDHSGSYLAVSCSDGNVYIYSLTSEQPQLIKKMSGVIKSLETDAEASSKVIWHPDGRAFGVPTASRGIQVVSRGDWELQRLFEAGHLSDITGAAWSPNGALLATAGVDRKILLWDTKSQRVVKTVDEVRATILALAWHPSENTLSYTNNDGELFIHTDFIPSEIMPTFQLVLQSAPLLRDPLGEVSGNARAREDDGAPPRRVRKGTPETIDDILGSDAMSDVDGFVEDDDGAGYVEEQVNGFGKRPLAGDGHDHSSKRRAVYGSWQPRQHEAFQPGSTPWRGNRRYLCLNLIGFVWTVDQGTHHTVTVEFYDREFQRDFHFTDPFLYDKACLNANGTLCASPPSDTQAAMLYYRPHETWTTRTDWRTPLPKGETAVTIAMSESYIVAVTSSDYVRVFTLFGTPVRVYRLKNSPAVTCAAWRDYVLTVGNGPVAGDGRPRLSYSIENVRRDEVCQSEDVVALRPGSELQSVFFSDEGDPFIYDTTGTLLTLLHWRAPSQARWVPVLDTTQLARLASGRKTESYWPVAVSHDRFHCIILKGGDKHPYFPRPLLTDFEFRIPISNPPRHLNSHTDNEEDNDGAEDDDPDTTQARNLESGYLLHTLRATQLRDLDASTATASSSSTRTELARHVLEADKALLQLLAAECRAGEDRGMKALELVGLMRDRSGRMVEAAQKVAGRFGREVLGQKILELGERRLIGLDGDDGLDDEV